MSRREIEGRCIRCGGKDIICPTCSPSGWVDASEELPAPLRVVLVWTRVVTRLASWSGKEWYLGDTRWSEIMPLGGEGTNYEKITHWMELPAPPTGEE
jgi:hypothetical protein